jgi:peptide/nickel transport system substrate-binding protein
VREIGRNPSLRIIALTGLDYAFMQFNLRDPNQSSRAHPLFADRELRRALTMAVNRAEVVRNIMDTFAVVPVGPTVRAYPTTDTLVTQLPYDTARASRTLDSLGWSGRDQSGTRIRNGKPLAFSVIVPGSSVNRMRAAVIIQEQLRRVGVRMQIDQMDNSAFGARWSGRKFDAALGAWNMGSTPGATPRAWGTAGISANGINFGSYSNPAFDAAVDSALTTPNLRLARAHFTRAYRTINEDAAAIWLYEPKNVVAIHRRLRPAGMRRGAWWIDLASWWIPAGERLDRDLTVPSR